MTNSTPSQNTLDLARQGDAEAIAKILTYHLTQRYNMTASALRLGDYLSVLVESGFAPEPAPMVQLVQEIMDSLEIEGITTIEISARQIAGGEVLWSQTIEMHSEHFSTPMNDETVSSSSSTSSDSAVSATGSTETILETAIASPNLTATSLASIHSEEATLPTSTLTSSANYQTPDLTLSAPPQPLAHIDSELQDDEWSAVFKKVAQRPEMLAVVAFALLVVLWDAYIEWMSDADSTQPLSATKLARRLGVTNSTLANYKYRPNFSTWSQDLDPDGIPWSYEGNQFVPKVPL